jgi:hypothetical protein
VRSFVRWGVAMGGLAAVAGLACSDGDNAAPSTATGENQPLPAATGTESGGTPAATPGSDDPASGAESGPNDAAGATPEGSELPAGTAAPGAETPAEMSAATETPASVFAGEACSGCARFAVPMDAGDQVGMFELNLPEPVDMTNTTITWRVMAVGFAGTSGGVSPYVRDAQNRDQCFIWTNLSSLGAWTDVTCEFSERFPGGANDAPFLNQFDRATVAKIGLQIHSGGVAADAVYSNALVYLDSVTFSDGVSPDIRFDASIGDLALVPAGSAAPDGTSVDFLGQ